MVRLHHADRATAPHPFTQKDLTTMPAHQTPPPSLTGVIASSTGVRQTMAVELRAGIRRFQIMSKMWGVIARAEAARPDQEPLTDDEVFETLAGERAVRLSMAEILYAKGRTADADRDIQNADIIAELLPARQASLSEVRDFCFYYLLEHQITADDIGLGRTLSTLREHFSNFPAAAAVRIIRELLADPRPQKRQRPQTGAATPPTTESETPS